MGSSKRHRGTNQPIDRASIRKRNTSHNQHSGATSSRGVGEWAVAAERERGCEDGKALRKGSVESKGQKARACRPQRQWQVQILGVSARVGEISQQTEGSEERARREAGE